MRVMIWSVAPWLGSAYANNGRNIALGLRDKGYEVLYLACYGFEGGPIEVKGMEGIQVFGARQGTMGVELVGNLIYNLEIDHVIQHFDTWQLGDFLPKSGLGPLVTCYAPIESETVPKATLLASGECFIVAPTEVAQRGWQKYGVPAVWIPHGVDTGTFSPISAQERTSLREGYALPADAFVFCIVAQNNWRKNLGNMVRAFTRVVHRYPGKPVYLMLHTALQEDPVRPTGASDLEWLIKRLKIDQKVRTPIQWAMMYLTHQELARVYQVSDVNLFATCAEGFGMPVIEAGACGVPSIVTDFAASPEVCGQGGITVRPSTKFDRMSPGEQGVYPSQRAVEQAMIRLIDDSELLADLSHKARQNAESYSWSKVIQYWDYYLKGRPEAKISPGSIVIGDKPTGDT